MDWDVEMGRHIQTGTDKLDNNVQIQTGICTKQLNYRDTSRCIDRGWIYNYCRLVENDLSRTYKDGWVGMWAWDLMNH